MVNSLRRLTSIHKHDFYYFYSYLYLSHLLTLVVMDERIDELHPPLPPPQICNHCGKIYLKYAISKQFKIFNRRPLRRNF